MKNKAYLEKKLKQIDGRSYKQYKGIRGSYDFEDYILYIDYVQGDPFASPSKLRVRMPIKNAGIDFKYYNKKSKRIALEDFLGRNFSKEIFKNVKGNRGSGKSGLIAIDSGNQEILERTAVKLTKEYVEVRFIAGLPAKGRRVLGLQAIEMLFNEVSKLVNNSIVYKNLNKSLMMDFLNLAEDQEYLRNQMKSKGLISFVANGAILPRESGISDKPMHGDNVVAFKSPKSMEVEFNLPNRGIVKGMGITKGVTLIVGGGYHGKSTLLNAIERGVYNHKPNDGRELVLTIKDAVKIRAEDGRSVEKVNITPFISNLPHLKSTEEFSTPNASGSTSQATNIMEALEVGTNLLLLDEDTSATNFMIRDGRMQSLVAKEKEPITPFIDRIRELYNGKNVSTILVVGGSGDYFEVSDNVIMMENYRPIEVTQKAKNIAKEFKNIRNNEGLNEFGEIKHRIPLRRSLEIKGRKKKVKTKGLHKILYGKTAIELSYVEQLIDDSQTEAIGCILKYIYKKYLDEKSDLKTIIDKVITDIEKNGLEIISSFNAPSGNLALPRHYEIATAINRLRNLKMK
ncbi:MAG: ATPase [Firmicutes bacterium]|nr:ATPase [Bacillota bacterium]